MMDWFWRYFSDFSSLILFFDYFHSQFEEVFKKEVEMMVGLFF
jgi:hypothetical protein